MSTDDNKKELELCALILNVSFDEYIGFETNQLRLIHVKRNSLTGVIIDKYDTVRFVSAGTENGFTLVKEGTTPRVTAPPANNVRILNSNATIRCCVAFSNDPNHASYNKSVAVSDEYGYIEIPNEKSRDYLLDQTKYETEITIAQWSDPRKPIFKAVSDLLEVTTRSNTDHVFFEALRKFENRVFHDTRQNHLASTAPPRGSVRERFVPPKSAPPATIDWNKIVANQTHVRALMLEVFESPVNQCYGWVWTKYGEIPMRTSGMISGTAIGDALAGEMLKVGQWVDVRLEYRNNRVMVRKFVEPTLELHSKFARIEEHGGRRMFLFENWLNISDKNVLFEKDGTRYIKDSCLGTVEVGPRIYSDIGDALAIYVEYHKLPTGKNVDGHDIYWVAHKKLPKREQEDSSAIDATSMIREMENMRMTENGTRGHSTPSPPPPPMSRPESMLGSVGDGYRRSNRQTPFDMRSSAPSQRDYYPPPSRASYVPMSQFNSNKDRIESKGIVTEKRSNYYVVFLQTNTMAALICDELFTRPNIQVGTTFHCEFVDRVEDKETEGIHWEVINILHILADKVEMRVEEDQMAMCLHVNLCKIDRELNEQVDYGGQHVLLSNDVTYVLIADRVATPSGDVVDQHQLVRRYKGKSKAENLTGYAKYSLTKVPRKLVDNTYDGHDDVDSYMWQLIKLVGNSTQFERQQRNLEAENLGHRLPEYLEDDDIAREKLRIKREAEQRNAQSEYGTAAGSQYASRAPSDVYFSSRDSTASRGTYQYNQNSSGSSNGQGPSSAYPRAPSNGQAPNDYNELKDRYVNAIRCLQQQNDMMKRLLSEEAMSRMSPREVEDCQRQLEKSQDIVDEMYTRKYHRN